MKGNNQAYTADKMKAISALSRRLVHDLNNFSTIVLNVSELLKDDVEGNEEALSKLAMLDSASDRFQEFIAQMAKFRFDISGKDTSCNVDSVVTKAVDEVDCKKIISLTGFGKNRSIKMSEDGFKHILCSLINNAAEAGAKNIKINAKADGDDIIFISVEDDGKGLTEEELSRVFEPFFTAKEHNKTAGLSLCSAFYALAGCGGNISIESESGKGAVVTLKVPAGEYAQSGSKAESSDIKNHKQESNSAREILVVDDQAPLRKIAQEILERGGYKVISAASGDEAIELASQPGHNIEILLTDIVMPTMSGKELAAKLKARFSDMKVLLMSGYNRDSNESEPDEEGFGFVNKPFTKNDLLEAVGKALR